jgi:hypothetical protein
MSLRFITTIEQLLGNKFEVTSYVTTFLEKCDALTPELKAPGMPPKRFLK